MRSSSRPGRAASRRRVRVAQPRPVERRRAGARPGEPAPFIRGGSAHAERVSWPRQVRGAAVVRGGGRGAEADAIWTDVPHEPVMVVTADCLPVALVRLGGRPAVALAHVGWRGLLAGVVDATVAALGGRQVAAAVGPGIGPCCTRSTGTCPGPVRAAFGPGFSTGGGSTWRGRSSRRYGRRVRPGRPSRRVHLVPSRALLSHRRDEGLTGRRGAIAMSPEGSRPLRARVCGGRPRRDGDRRDEVCALAKMGVLAEAGISVVGETARRTS